MRLLNNATTKNTPETIFRFTAVLGSAKEIPIIKTNVVDRNMKPPVVTRYLLAFDSMLYKPYAINKLIAKAIAVFITLTFI
ncbi:MAG: hypothetical protein A2W62_02155 [Alphaproteobacteria bacterium RIFCSPLOWO2_02_42_7]|nr:MAG: hypothetical protein A2W62_02155 [Alphaproteobacteria bacterium RIFCSPLOWO2_02_42_7]